MIMKVTTLFIIFGNIKSQDLYRFRTQVLEAVNHTRGDIRKLQVTKNENKLSKFSNILKLDLTQP